MSIILCGLPMCGKTTIGRALAQHLNWNFVDTDELIEHAYHIQTHQKYSCRQIFVIEREARFRELEKEQITTLNGLHQAVISIGGGALGDQANINVLKKVGRFIYLNPPIEEIWKRVGERGIPAYLDKQHAEQDFYALVKKRTPLYESVADEVINTAGLTIQEVIGAIHLMMHHIEPQKPIF